MENRGQEVFSLMKTVRCIFKGKVQGVFFRAYTRDFAIALGIRGWVRNLPDGSVEAVFQGEEEKIKEVIKKLCNEHPYAVVSETETFEMETKEVFEDFSIRY